MHQLEYLVPSEGLQAAAQAFKNDFVQQGENFIHGSCRWDGFDKYEDWLRFYRRVHEGQEPGRVPSSTYFVQQPAEGVLVGMIDIRHALRESHAKYGHIGYSVAPGQRRKGYGSAILQWGLAKAWELGVENAVLCCYADNLPSRKTIEKCGLVLQEEILEPESGKRIYMYTQHE